MRRRSHVFLIFQLSHNTWQNSQKSNNKNKLNALFQDKITNTKQGVFIYFSQMEGEKHDSEGRASESFSQLC